MTCFTLFTDRESLSRELRKKLAQWSNHVLVDPRSSNPGSPFALWNELETSKGTPPTFQLLPRTLDPCSAAMACLLCHLHFWTLKALSPRTGTGKTRQ